MNSSDFGNSIIGAEGVAQKRNKFKRAQLASKYKVGGKVKARAAAIAGSLDKKRAALKRKYAQGGSVEQSAPQPAGGSWWQRLQTEIQALTQQSPMASAQTNANQGVAQPASNTISQGMQGGIPAQQAQPSTPLGGG